MLFKISCLVFFSKFSSDIEKEIEVIASERAKAEALLQSQISDLTRAQEELTTKLKLFEYRDNASIYGIWPIVLICENFRQFRPNNICGTQMLLLGANGAAYKEKKDYLRCSNCGGNFTLRILEYRV